jgi:hypothetical protein
MHGASIETVRPFPIVGPQAPIWIFSEGRDAHPRRQMRMAPALMPVIIETWQCITVAKRAGADAIRRILNGSAAGTAPK